MAQGKFLEDLEMGMSAIQQRTITEKDIQLFAEVSGDHDPVHLDESFARATQFKGRIAHGFLTASFISAAFGNELPGPGSIYLSQTLRFKAPVRIGDIVEIEVKVTGIDTEKARVQFSTICRVGGKAVLEGEALLMVPRRSSQK